MMNTTTTTDYIIDGVNDTESMIVNNLNMLTMRYNLTMRMIKLTLTNKHVGIINACKLIMLMIQLITCKHMITIDTVKNDYKYQGVNTTINMINKNVDMIHNADTVKSAVSEPVINRFLNPMVITTI